MPFNVPNLDDIYKRAIALINAELSGADANLKKSILNIVALVLAQMSKAEYNYLKDYVVKQLFITSCDQDTLLKYANIKNFPPKAPVKASGSFAAIGVNGSVIAAGTQCQRLDGFLYETTADSVISAGAADVPVIALSPGAAGNAIATTVIQFVSPPIGVNQTGLVDANGITGGADAEAIEDFRARFLEFIQTPPQGGAEIDYKIWAEEVPGVRRAFITPLEFGLGTVSVRFLMVPTDSNPNGIPTDDDVTAVRNYIEARRPVTAKNIAYIKPVPVNLSFNVRLLVDDNIDVRNAVTAELKAMLLRDSVPGGTIYVSRIVEAISLAKGEYACELISPAADVVYATGQMAVFGGVTFS